MRDVPGQALLELQVMLIVADRRLFCRAIRSCMGRIKRGEHGANGIQARVVTLQL